MGQLHTIVDSGIVSNAALSEMTFTNYGSPASEALNVYVVNQSGGGGGGNSNITQWNSVNLGSPSNYGTSPGAVEVIGVNAYITNIPAVSQSGTWNIGTVTTVTTVSAVTAITNALPSGANTIGAVTQASGPWTVNLTQVDSVALGAPSAYGTSPGAVNVIGVNAYVTSLPAITVAASQTIAVTNTGTFAVQAAQSGTWNINTLTSITNPVAVTGTFWPATQPVSNAALTEMTFTNYGSPASEALNVYVVNPSSSVVSGTVAVSNFPASQAVTGTFWQTTQPVSNPVLSEMTFTNYGSPAVEALNVYVVNPSSGGGSGTQQTATWNSSTTANTAITASVVGYSTVLVTFAQTGNCLGLSVYFEASDTAAGTNWYTLYGIEDQTGNTPVFSYLSSTNTTAHSFLINVAGWNQFRLRVNGTTVQSGNLVAAFTPQTASCTQFVGVINLVSLGAGTALIGSVKLSDGPNTMGTMTLFGTTPTGSANALVTNASLFQGTAAISATNPLVTEIGDGTHTVTLTTYSSKYGLDTNLLGTLGTAFTTAGFVDIKGADGNVFVRQTTGSNLHTVIDSGTITNITNQVGVTNAALSEMSFTLYEGSSPAMEGLNVYVMNQPPTVATTGGCAPKGFHISNNTVQVIKATFGQLYSYYLDNSANAATTYFQFFNLAAGSVTLGTTPSLFCIPVPAGSAANLSMSMGWTFTVGMSFAATTTYNGSTAPASAVDCTLAWT